MKLHLNSSPDKGRWLKAGGVLNFNHNTMTLLSTKRHSLAHVMAQAVKQLYPEAKIATGPDTEDGFYYDFDFGTTEFSDKDLKEVEKTMKKIITQNQDFRKFEVSI
ncbi:MAG: hypothetical protein Q8S84_05325 [bacterium]|nr:hypothetical protein [bacterium]MDP3380915.1 hypothetical protein [bacterium]